MLKVANAPALAASLDATLRMCHRSSFSSQLSDRLQLLVSVVGLTAISMNGQLDLKFFVSRPRFSDAGFAWLGLRLIVLGKWRLTAARSLRLP